jgi:hypothetical protein
MAGGHTDEHVEASLTTSAQPGGGEA